MLSRCTETDILNCLRDYRKHTIAEIAEYAEVSCSTVKRYITVLTLHYPIKTFVGGRDSGGVQLERSHEINEHYVTRHELNQILRGLNALKSNGEDVTNLIRKLTPTYPDSDGETNSSGHGNL